MKAQPVKKTTGILANGVVVSNSVKSPVNVPTIAADSDQQLSYWRDQVEDFFTELTKLRCLSGLLNGQNEHNDITLSELCYLIDPSVERLKAICDELGEVFYRRQIAFVQEADERSNSTDAA